jgi:hypothetical protein
MQIRALVLFTIFTITASLLSVCGQPLPITPTTATPLKPRLIATPSHKPQPTSSQPPATSTVPPVTATPAPTATPADALTQYRHWMDEARTLHPYPEDIEQMWAVMICESKGDPSLVAWPYHGLFQYQPETWGGDWNPYRDQPILDPHAQIFATAKAWQDGYQSWWGCYR